MGGLVYNLCVFKGGEKSGEYFVWKVEDGGFEEGRRAGDSYAWDARVGW